MSYDYYGNYVGGQEDRTVELKDLEYGNPNYETPNYETPNYETPNYETPDYRSYGNEAFGGYEGYVAQNGVAAAEDCSNKVVLIVVIIAVLAVAGVLTLFTVSHAGEKKEASSKSTTHSYVADADDCNDTYASNDNYGTSNDSTTNHYDYHSEYYAGDTYDYPNTKNETNNDDNRTVINEYYPEDPGESDESAEIPYGPFMIDFNTQAAVEEIEAIEVYGDDEIELCELTPVDDSCYFEGWIVQRSDGYCYFEDGYYAGSEEETTDNRMMVYEAGSIVTVYDFYTDDCAEDESFTLVPLWGLY